MSFAVPLFLWYFLPAVLLATWVLPRRARNGVLAISSLAFYAVGGKEFVFLLLALIAVNYAAGLAIGALPPRRRKPLLIATVVAEIVAADTVVIEIVQRSISTGHMFASAAFQQKVAESLNVPSK